MDSFNLQTELHRGKYSVVNFSHEVCEQRDGDFAASKCTQQAPTARPFSRLRSAVQDRFAPTNGSMEFRLSIVVQIFSFSFWFLPVFSLFLLNLRFKCAI